MERVILEFGWQRAAFSGRRETRQFWLSQIETTVRIVCV
jgi:hypothetical protein